MGGGFVACFCYDCAKSYIEFRLVRGQVNRFDSLLILHLRKPGELELLRMWTPVLFLSCDRARTRAARRTGAGASG